MKNLVSSGFTLVEVILYVSIVSVILSALIPFGWSVIEGGAKNDAQREVYSQARVISERIKYEIRNATGINSISATNLSLAKSNSAINPTVINLSSGKIQITQGVGGTTYDLNSLDTQITALTFTDYSFGVSKNIQFEFTIDDSYTGSRQEFQVPAITIRSAAEIRNN